MFGLHNSGVSNIGTLAQSVVQKALNGSQWEVAHPLTLNYEAPISSRDATICVSSEGTYSCVHRSDRGSVI